MKTQAGDRITWLDDEGFLNRGRVIARHPEDDTVFATPQATAEPGNGTRRFEGRRASPRRLSPGRVIV